MGFEQSEINEVFGVSDESADNGANGNEETSGTGDAATEGNTPEAAAEESTDAGTGSTESVGQAQSEADNRRFAAARRRAEAERDRAIAEERANSERYINEAIASLGITDPSTGAPITTKAQYDAVRSAQAANAKNAFMQQNGLTEAEYNGLISNLPEVQAARQALAEAERAAKESSAITAKMRIDEQLKEISKMDSSVKSLDDLMAMDTYPQFYELVKKGNSFTDAYKLANYSRLVERAAAAEKQRTLNAQTGKAHLMPQNAGQGQGLPSVPADVAEYYRLINPEMSAEEIARDYAKRNRK